MAMKDTIIKKLQQATCDKTELNKKVVSWQKSLKEAEKASLRRVLFSFDVNVGFLLFILLLKNSLSAW